jgi:hypothetical protein
MPKLIRSALMAAIVAWPGQTALAAEPTVQVLDPPKDPTRAGEDHLDGARRCR